MPQTDRTPCSRTHPGYVGDLPADPQDADFVRLVSETPYIGDAAALLLQFGGMLKGGPVCIEDHTTDNTTPWTAQLIAGCVFAGSLVILAIAYAIKRGRKK